MDTHNLSFRSQPQRERQRRQRVSTDAFCVFPFLGKGAETRCFCCRGGSLSCSRVLAELGRTRGDSAARCCGCSQERCAEATLAHPAPDAKRITKTPFEIQKSRSRPGQRAGRSACARLQAPAPRFWLRTKQ